MFNSIILDVFIGLVLVYLLYSLLITIVGEMVATWINLRPRILRLSIEKMLNDGYFHNASEWPASPAYMLPWIIATLISTWRIIQSFFLREFKDFKYSFAGRFYQVPIIKYLTDTAGEKRTMFSQTKPSYISDVSFADALTQLLMDRGSGTDEMEKIRFTLTYNTHHIHDSTLKHLQDMAVSSEMNLQVFKEKLRFWYNETQDRATGWYKRKMQLILFWMGFVVAVIFNIDSIRIARLLTKDKDARNELVRMGIELSKDTARYKNFVIRNGDSLHPQQIIDSGYSHISDDIRDANLVLGLGWGTDKLRKFYSYEIDSLTAQNLFKTDNDLSKYKRAKDTIPVLQAAIDRRMDTIDINAEIINNLRVDTTGADSASLKPLKDSIIKTQAIIRQMLVRISRDSLAQQLRSNSLAKTNAIIDSLAGKSFAIIKDVRKSNHGKLLVLGTRRYYWYEKIGFVLNKVRHFQGFWGFFITGLMISLGSPFWFDLLKRLVALRGAGVKPEEKPVKKSPETRREEVEKLLMPPPQPPAPKRVNSKAALALELFTQQTLDDPGIIAIGIEYTKDNNQPFLNVMAENINAKNFLQNKYGVEKKLEDGFTIPIAYSVGDEITLHFAMEGAEIANQTVLLGSGTLGCHLKKRGSDDLFFLSCWHVMKDNARWNETPKNTTIISGGKPLGRIVRGFLSHHPATGMDAAIAQYTTITDAVSNPDFIIKKQYRAVTPFDFAVSTPVTLCGKVSGVIKAAVFHDTINARIKYPDGKTYLMNDVFSIVLDGDLGGKKLPTTHGDSGAVVIDEKGAPLGMVIGGGGNFSYAIKFTNLFEEDKPFKDYFFKI
jgi:hypothetical protein